MARGKRKETGANTKDVKKAKVGLHAGDMLPALPELYDDADNPVQLTVRLSLLLVLCLIMMFASCD